MSNRRQWTIVTGIVMTAVFGITLTVIIWQSLVGKDRDSIQRYTESVARIVRDEVWHDTIGYLVFGQL